MCEFVWKEDDAEQEQNVIVTRHHVLGAEIHEGDQMEPDDLLNKALVADRHRMGERIARQDRDGSYRDRKAGHERPVSPSPSVVEKPSGHPFGLARPRPSVTERPPTHVLTLSRGRGYGQDMPDDHLRSEEHQYELQSLMR